MMFNRFVIVLILTISHFAYGQYPYEYDTLSINHRMFGKVDSTDVLSGILPSTFDGGVGVFDANGFSILRLNNDFGGQRFHHSSEKKTLKFSALPFIGFAYSFGGQGTQFVRAQYVQAFTDSLVLNIDYAGNIGNGFLRNSSFRSNNIQLNLDWKSSWFTLQFEGVYHSDSLEHNGGIVTDTLIEPFGLEFTPVWKSNAAAKNIYGRARLTNYFHFNKTSTNRVGLLTRHTYDIKYRAYHEIDTLAGIYNQVNIDPETTYDRLNLAQLQNSAGAFFARRNNYLDFQIGQTYWSNLNLGNDFDTSEIDIESNLRWNFGRLVLNNKFKQNLIGGFGAMLEEASVQFNQPKWSINGNLSLRRSAPLPFQRSYFANNYNYKLDAINLDNRLVMGASAMYRIKGDSITVGASLNSLTIRNAYIFEDTMWNQTGSLDALQIAAFGQFRVKNFHFHPRFTYSIEPNSYLPQVQINARVYFKSTIFKAKKLLLLIGLDGSFVSAYQPRNFIPSIDAYLWNQNLVSTKGMANAHFFTSIEISTFRFFVRYENIGYFWNDRTLLEYVGYPISGQRIRLGLTWNFFN